MLIMKFCLQSNNYSCASETIAVHLLIYAKQKPGVYKRQSQEEPASKNSEAKKSVNESAA